MATTGRGKAIYLKDDNSIHQIKHNPRGPIGLQRTWDALVPGLILAVRPAPSGRGTGKKTWSLRYDIKGKQSILKIGDYPATGLDEARALAGKLKQAASDGQDVKAILKYGAAGTGTTVKELFEHILRESTYPFHTTSSRYQYAMDKSFRKHIYPAFGSVPIGKVNRGHWKQLIVKLRKEGKNGTALTVVSLAGLLYKNLAEHADEQIAQLINPLKIQPINIPKAVRDRVFTNKELQLLWEGFEDPIHRSITRILILTGQRVNDVLRSRWELIENDIWVVGQKGEMKNKNSAHHLPLTKAIRREFKSMKEYGSDWVFKGYRGHYSYSGFLSALHRLKDEHDLPPFAAHTFRHTFMTRGLDDADLDYIEAERVLHHTLGTMGDKYAHGQALKYKKRALKQWAKYLRKEVGIDA